MPKPRQRTRSKKRVSTTVPGGNRRADYRRKEVGISRCNICGRLLTGISASPLHARKLNRSRRRIWRLYGGQVCPGCLRIALKQVARMD